MSLLDRLKDRFFDAGVEFIRFAMQRGLRKDFENAAQGAGEWPTMFISSEGLSESGHQVGQKIYRQAFVVVMREKRESFLRNGKGVDYINGVLLSLDQCHQSEDVLNDLLFGAVIGDLKGEGAGEILCREMLDFADDALDADMNRRNRQLASAYLLNLMEAYPQMKEILPQDDVQQATRDILSRIQDEDSCLIDPVLRGVLNDYFAKYRGAAPVLKFIPGGNG